LAVVVQGQQTGSEFNANNTNTSNGKLGHSGQMKTQNLIGDLTLPVP